MKLVVILKLMIKGQLAGGFRYFFMFTPNIGEDSHFD